MQERLTDADLAAIKQRAEDDLTAMMIVSNEVRALIAEVEARGAEIEALKAERASYEWTLRDVTEGAQILLAAERDKARAEAVVLREALGEIASGIDWGEDTAIKRTINYYQQLARQALSHPGPGAEYREYVRKLEAVAESTRVMMNATRPANEELAKADMRATLAALAALDAHGKGDA